MYPLCTYWDFLENKWINNNNLCFVSYYNKSFAYCSCRYLFSPILRLDKELIYIQLNITENYDVISLNINNMFNVYPIPLYIVGCLSLIIMTFIVILSEKYNIPLWLEKETNIQNSILNKSKLINEEMGTIYFIYQINKFQRCCNLYTLNVKNNWFFTQIFCRLYGCILNKNIHQKME